MKKKCQNGLRSYKGVCTPTKKNVVEIFRHYPTLVYSILVATLVSVGGWLMYNWLTGVTGLRNYSPWWQFLAGLLILTGATILGWRKIR